MKRSTLTFALAMALSSRVANAAPSTTPTDAPMPSSSSMLIIEVDAGVPKADSIKRSLEESGNAVLMNLQPSIAADARILIHVSGEQYDYQIRTYIARGDTQVDGKTERCECSDTELQENVDAEIQQAAALLAATPPTTKKPSNTKAAGEEYPQEQAPSNESSPPPRISTRKISPSELAPIDRPTTTPERVDHDRTVRRTKIAGVATLIAGSALLFVGAGMALAGSRELIDKWPHYKRDWRPPGFAIGGVGLAGIAVGGSLMILDDILCRRRPDSCKLNSQYAKRSGFTHLFKVAKQ